MNLIGYHGTSAENESSIVSGNFNVSANDDEWLGTGAYFFIDGVSCPKENAEKWAIFRSRGGISYKRYSVLSVDLSLSSPLDLDTDEGANVFCKYRDALLEKMKDEGLKPSRKLMENDCKVCNVILETTEVDAIIRKEYIQLDTLLRGHLSRVPNCRIISVKNPDTSVSNIRACSKGEI
ncbi:hypothetical protein J7S50_01190 [Providencia rettgeri]|uniref:hypothetical protein n=1 Tax=Providencia TaxID=586 RepID=UPI001B3992A1|nr:hypothetical protein [Providencia rettgeri]MBQ0207804.1 hypothetical protein [Providencia rettgeri]